MIENVQSYYSESYEKTGVLPTFGSLSSEDDLRQHEARRTALYRDKLHLPPRLFKGANLIEFGPDAGENATVFARLGAELTLVEPNPGARQHISEYFSRFELQHSLRALVASDVERFQTSDAFDFVVAEGFLEAVKPHELWASAFSRLLAKNGFVIVSYNETFGGVIELLHKAIYARVKTLTGLPSVEAARLVYEPKWGTIPHTRSFESWVMDVMDNPFVRLYYSCDAIDVCRDALSFGLELYSSWPRYEDTLDVYWHKTERSSATRLEQSERWIKRNHLTYALGRKLFLGCPDEVVEHVDAALRTLLAQIDQLIDSFDPEMVNQGQAALKEIETSLQREDIVVEMQADRAAAASLVASIAEIFRLIGDGRADTIAEFCRRDPTFLQSWGMPFHFAVFQRATT